MTVGTPVTLEMAIMFLYGKKPKLTQENIEHMISLAEFLLIQNLKSACIRWLKTADITEENCMDILQLSSIYNFEIPTCEEYLLSHMLEMLHHTQMVNLSKDSVQYLLSDRKLSYVSMDDKVTFLMRWANSQLARRKSYLRELFEEIDFQDVRKTVLDELKADQNASDEIDLENLVSDLGNEILQTHRVLIMKGETTDGTFWCLDLEKEEWFRLKPETNQEEGRTPYMYYGEISGATDVGSEIYFKQRNYRQSNVLILNLEEDVCNKYQIVHEGSGDNFKEINGLCITSDICVAYVNERVKTNKQTRHETESMNIDSRLRLMSLLGVHPMEQFLALKMIEDDNIRTNQHVDIATLYMGRIQNDEIKLSPLLTFKDNKIAGMCINKMLTVAVIFGSRKVVSLFDLVDYQMETMQLKTEYADELSQSQDGFIIHNNKRCICLTRITGPSLSSKFKSKEVQFVTTGSYENKYIFCGNSWYHYYRRKRNDHFIFETASQNDMISKPSIEDVTWKTLPLPKEETKCYSSTIKSSFFQISLPKSKLRCAIECPHCKKPSIVRRTFVAEYDDDDSSYDDSSDDEYYGHGYYMDNDDYGYYVDSD